MVNGSGGRFRSGLGATGRLFGVRGFLAQHSLPLGGSGDGSWWRVPPSYPPLKTPPSIPFTVQISGFYFPSGV